MKLTTIGKFLALALCIAGVSFGAIIDDFSVVQTPPTAGAVDYSIGGPVVNDVQGFRTLGADLTTGANAIGAAVSGGFFYGITGTDSAGTVAATYTGLWDLTGQAGLGIDLIYKESQAGSIMFGIYDGSVLEWSAWIPLAAPGFYQADFSGYAGNLAAITNAAFVVQLSENLDTKFDNFQTAGVPEPATFALMAAGLLGLFAVRRKRA